MANLGVRPLTAAEQAIAAAMLERDLEAQVKALSAQMGLLYYHTHRSDRSPSGYPDDTLVGTRVLFRELKREKEKPTRTQQEWIDRLRAAGADVAVWRPRDLFSGRILREMHAISPAVSARR